ncbi:MAG: FAD-binding oxidoreductase, partial [Steroidobacteraceae bacterium]
MPPLSSAQALSGLEHILGADGLLGGGESPGRSQADLQPYLTDQRRLYHGRALAVALPRTVAEVTQLLAFCNDHRIGVVPQGGNTGYCGGATPDESGAQIVVSLSRLNRVRQIDALDYSIVA